MNITFLIGNGFDLNLGLRTKYSDFLEDYCNKMSGSKVIDSFRADVAQNLPLWSNAEMEFGKYTKKFNKVTEFCDCHMDFCLELAKYLKKQEARLIFDNLKETVPSLFVKSIKAFKFGFREEQQEQIQSCLSPATDGYTYNFITFNYTKVLDKFVSMSKNSAELGKTVYIGHRYDNLLGSVLHIHGFTDKDMVLGLNDESQIRNMNLFAGQPEEYIGQIIKRQTNKLNEEHMDEKCEELLRRSDFIYIYGMSIGETDAIWWQRICTLLNEKEKLRIIIHSFNAPEEQIIRTKYLQHERSVKEKFVNYSRLNAERKRLIMGRIHVSSKNIFLPLSGLVDKGENKVKAVSSA